MAEPHDVLNALAPEEARAALTRCCGSTRWVEGMLARRPFASTAELRADADELWWSLGPEDFLEAFAAHPRIGVRTTTDAWARQEQSSVGAAGAELRAALAEANDRYLRRFGHIFIVYATGKTAAEMLGLLEARMPNDPDHELSIAAGEQAKITQLRLEKLAS
jgi:2-oxo-4-hydroxy-4-carboxy-5-ureidoimidazoline decarboxylase